MTARACPALVASGGNLHRGDGNGIYTHAAHGPVFHGKPVPGPCRAHAVGKRDIAPQRSPRGRNKVPGAPKGLLCHAMAPTALPLQRALQRQCALKGAGTLRLHAALLCQAISVLESCHVSSATSTALLSQTACSVPPPSPRSSAPAAAISRISKHVSKVHLLILQGIEVSAQKKLADQCYAPATRCP
eukprot:TRINITY_DN924_c0_g1_i2.p1 TRINITY_DN924_c0_g1~~TRINITY_DN924_c0_g1_i2.p1  ORF type:complete len:188 (-),score=9.96 TRINITY_DN924_c0_g1_i2:389-952(-)